MLTSIKGHYNGSQIVLEENVGLTKGQKLIITVLDPEQPDAKEIPDLSRYMGRGKSKIGRDAHEYIREMRDHDRI